MSVSVGNIVAHLDVQDKMSRKLEAAKKKFRAIGDAAAKNGKKVAAMGDKMNKMGNSARNAGVQLTAGLTLPIVALGAKALVSFANFESGMNRVRAILGPNATQKDFRDLTATAEHLGRTTRFTAVEASEAMGFFALAGFKANEIMEAMPGTLDLAAAGQMEVAKAADIAAKTLRGYGMAATEVGRVSDVMAKAFTSANTDLTQLGEAMKYAGPVAKSAGLEFEDLTAALALMADAGFQGTMGGTAVRGAIVRMLAPTKKSADIMKRLGINVSDAAGRMVPLDEIIRQLEPHADKTGDMMVLFGQRAGPALASLVGRGSQALVELREELRNAGGTTKRIADIQMEGLKGAFIELQSAAEGLWIAIGQGLAPTFEALLDDIKGVVNYITSNAVPAFADLGEGTKKAAIGVAGGLALLGPLSVIFGQMSLAVGGLLGGLALLGKQGFKMTGVWAGLKTAGILLGKAFLVVGAAIAGWKIGGAIRDYLNLTPIVSRLFGRLLGLSKAQIDATESAIGMQESLKGVATTASVLEGLLDNLGKMDMDQLTGAFHNLARNNKIGRAEMELFVVSALELQTAGEDLSVEMAQLIQEFQLYDEATSDAQQATIRHNQALAEAAERAAAVAEAIHSIGFGEAREDLVKLKDTWAGLSVEERRNHAIMTDIANQYDVLSERLGDVTPEFNHLRRVVEQTTDQYKDAHSAFGTPLAIPALKDLPGHVRDAFKIGENWFQAIGDGFMSQGPVLAFAGATLSEPPAFPAQMHTLGKRMSHNIGQGFADSVAAIPMLLIDAFKGGGGFTGGMKAIGTQMGSQLGGDIFGAFGESMGKDSDGKAKTGLMGSIAGMMGPIGAAIGALAGPMISGIIGLFKGPSTTKRIQKAVTKHWGRAISEGLSDTIAKTADKIGSDWGGMMMHLSDIFTEAGGVMAFGLDDAIAKTRDLFSAVDMGTLTVAQASKSFDSSFKMIADAVVDTGRVANKEFLELLSLNKQFGFESVEALNFIEEQSTRVFNGLASMLGPLQQETGGLTDRFLANAKAMEAAGDDAEKLAQLQLELNKIFQDQQVLAEASKDELEAFAVVAIGAFGSAVEAGLGFVEAARLSSPAIATLSGAFEALGITSDNVAFNHLARWNDLILQNEALVDSVDAFDDVLVGLSLTGGLTGEALASMGLLAGTQFDRLIAAGFTSNEALVMMAPNIFALVDAYGALGIPIDEDTEKLLAMALANGAVHPEDQVSGWDLVTGAIDRLAVKLEALVQSILNVPDASVNINYNDPGFDPDVPPSMAVDVDYYGNYRGDQHPDPTNWSPNNFAHGGMGNFGAGTLAMLHGNEAVIPLEGGAVPVDLGRGGDGPTSMQVVEDRLTSIERLLRDQPRAFGLAIQDSLTLSN